MRRVLFAIAALSWAGAAHAQALQAIVADTNHAAAPSYTGSGDVVAVASGGFYGGVWAYTSAQRGAAVLNVCNSTGGVDVACADVSTDATTGLVPNAPVISGHTCSASLECTVKIIYNKATGLSDASSLGAVIADRATFKPSCQGSTPCLHFNGSQGYCSSGTTPFTQPNYTYTAAASISSLSGGNDRIIATFSSVTVLGVNGSNQFEIYSGAFAQSAAKSLNTFYAIIGTAVTGTGALTINVNGTQSTGTGGTTVPAGQLCYGSDGGLPMTGDVMEFRVDPTNLSNGDITTLTSNMRSRGGY